MALVIGHSQVKAMHHCIQDSSNLTLSYPGSRVDQLWSKLEDIAIIITILSPGCQQPFVVKMASDNWLSAAVFGPKWLDNRLSAATSLVILPLWNLIFFVNFDGDACASWRHHVIATGNHFEMGKQTITIQNLVNLE